MRARARLAAAVRAMAAQACRVEMARLAARQAAALERAAARAQAGEAVTSIAGAVAAEAAGTSDPAAPSEPAADGYDPRQRTTLQGDTAAPEQSEQSELIGAPEGAYALTAPEGFEISDELLAQHEPLFRELNLSQAGAQRLTEVASGMVRDAIATTTEQAAQAEAAAHQQREDGMRAALTADGYDMATFSDEKHPARRDAVAGAVGLLGGPEQAAQALKVLEDRGALPIVMPLLAKVGRAIKADGFQIAGKTVEGGGDFNARAKAAMYPNGT